MAGSSCKQQLGTGPPSRRQYDSMGNISAKTVTNQFGGWNKAALKAFGQVKKTKNPKAKTIKCLTCQKLTHNPKFCSRSCSAITNNKLIIKKIAAKKLCMLCNIDISGTKRLTCRLCRKKIKGPDGKIKAYSDLTLGDLKKTGWAASKIRCHARRIAKSNGILSRCQVCSYSLFVDCAHKRPVKNFPNDARLSEINNPSNLIGLCPNHHKEYDSGLLQI